MYFFLEQAWMDGWSACMYVVDISIDAASTFDAALLYLVAPAAVSAYAPRRERILGLTGWRPADSARALMLPYPPGPNKDLAGSWYGSR